MGISLLRTMRACAYLSTIVVYPHRLYYSIHAVGCRSMDLQIIEGFQFVTPGCIVQHIEQGRFADKPSLLILGAFQYGNSRVLGVMLLLTLDIGDVIGQPFPVE